MPQWFKFLISSHADCSSLRLSLHFSPPLAGLPLLFLLFAVLKPSNEIHIKQDGRLDAFLPAIHSAACLLLHLCFFFPFDTLSRSIYPVFIVFSVAFHLSFVLFYISLCRLLSSLWTSYSSRSYSSISPSWLLLLSLCLFILPIPSPSTSSFYVILCFATFPFLQAPLRSTLAIFPVMYLELCVFVCVRACTFGRQESALVLPKWEIHFCFALYHLPWSHLERCIYGRHGLC